MARAALLALAAILATPVSSSSSSATPASSSSSSAAAPRWKQDRFVISFWVDPIVDPSELDAAYATVAAANFTAVLGGFGALTPAAVTAQLAAAAAHGLAVIANPCEGESGPGPNGTSCVGLQPPEGAPPGTLMGWQVYDEPSAGDFPALALWMQSIASRAPGTLRFVNLLPNYGSFPSSSYGDYVDAFVAATQPDLLSFDHYPLWGAGAAGNVSAAGYHDNLAVVSSRAARAGIPFWNFFSSMPFNGRPDVTEAQLRWQTFTSLAYGARGLLYFCYWAPAGSPFVWGDAIMSPRAPLAAPASGGDPVYAPTAHYAQAARLNSRLRALGGWLFGAAPVATFLTNGTGTGNASVPSGAAGAGGGFITAVGGSGAGATWSVLLGGYAAPAPFTFAVLVHNQDVDGPLIVTLGLASPATASSPAEVDGSTGQPTAAWDDAPQIPGWQVTLEAGDARLFVF